MRDRGSSDGGFFGMFGISSVLGAGRGETSNLLSGVWLLWAGFGLSATMGTVEGASWFTCQCVSVPFYAIWAWNNVDGYHVMRSIFEFLASTFFKNFDVAGSARIPLDGPVIFACAPHANQFVDGLVVLKAVPQRKIQMLTAAKSMRRKYVGFMARTMQAIPVERPQDLAVRGDGKVRVIPEADDVRAPSPALGTPPTSTPSPRKSDGAPAFDSFKGTLIGQNTSFTTQMGSKDSIIFQNTKVRAVVVRVHSDTEALVRYNTSDEQRLSEAEFSSYKIIPHADQKVMFENCIRCLSKDGAIGIFPEGGSHDRTQLLPLKPGISIMALGTMAQHPNQKVTIVPVGINYFRGHRFRSRVFVDFGEPIVPDADLVEAYRTGGSAKRAACNELLKRISCGVQACIVEAPDFDTLQFFRALRRLYKPIEERMDASERFMLMKAFSEGYPKVKDEPLVKLLFEHVQTYRQELLKFRIPDHKIADATITGADPVDTFDRARLVLLLIYYFVLLIVFSTAALPGQIMATPMLFVTRSISKNKAVAAQKASSVKIAGRDVIATWKLMVSMLMVPLMHVLYTYVAFAMFGTTAGVGFFFFAPFMAGLGIIAHERTWKTWQQFKALYKVCLGQGGASVLVEKRMALQHEARRVIQELNWDAQLKDSISGSHLYRRYTQAEGTSGGGMRRNMYSFPSLLDMNSDDFFSNPASREKMD